MVDRLAQAHASVCFHELKAQTYRKIEAQLRGARKSISFTGAFFRRSVYDRLGCSAGIQ
jgi:hypothetical protein